MDTITSTIIERGDLAHLALFLWASGASGLLVWTLKELARAHQRFSDFVSEIAKVTRLLGGPRP
jgi:hypothetical protein